MLRRAFRNGLLVGLLGGAIAAALKAVQGRATSAPVTAPAWTPLPNAEPVVVPAAPVVPKAPRPTVDLSALQESPVEPKAKKPKAEKSEKSKQEKPKKAPPWVDPGPDGEPPASHPIKAKMASGIYHVPGGFNYPRTKPDRCYRDVAAAEADGLRPSKR